MRNNLPVTQREYDYPEEQRLVSTTDLQSRILYCNRNFIEVSGYTREELIGQEHNMIRHPDMPPEAFRDMWRSIGSGRPWCGMVKNRRKNGDHYWVFANVTPILERGKIQGYVSVRTKPTREQIDEAESLYARMRADAARGRATVRLEGGHVIGTHPGASLLLRFQTSVAAPIVSAMGALAAVSVVTAALMADWQTALAVGLAQLVGGLATMAWVRSRVVRPVHSAIGFANRLAAGDIAVRRTSRKTHDLGGLHRALRQLNVNLQAICGDMEHEVESLSVVTEQISRGTADLSARTESQASNLEETAAAMEQLSSTVKHNSDSSRDAKRLVTEANQTAQDSGVTVGRMIDTMRDINRSSDKVGEIIQVIESIAFQTNILALNAAVEAARAGEQGRGFAVVAGEVRALAQRATGAAREIKTLIDESSAKVHQGERTVEDAGAVMRGVVERVGQVAALITDFTNATDEQSIGISQVAEAIQQLDAATQNNAALVEESNSATDSLRAQARSLRDAMSVLRLGNAESRQPRD